MINRRTFIAGAALAIGAPLPAQALSPLNLDDVVLKPFTVAPLQGLTGVAAPSLDALMGQVTVLNFWASWCSACHGEHKLLLDLKAKGLRLAGIASSDEEGPALRYLEKQGNPFALVGFDGKAELKDMLGVDSLPQTFLIGPKAEIAWQTSRALDDELMVDLMANADRLKT